MGHITRMTMIGLYKYDTAVFEKLTLPDGINKDDFINSFLLKYGECPVIYPDWGFMQFALGVWSNKWYDSIQRIITAFTEEYNPLHNFDRHEEYTDNEDVGRTNSSTRDSSTSNTTKGTSRTDTDSTEDRNNDTNTNRNTVSEDTVSAYNEDGYQPDRKNETVENITANEQGNTEISGTSKTTDELQQNGTGKDTISGNENTDRKLVHEGHLYGNIGVTESTAMLMHEKDLREKYNIIDIVCDMLYREICIYIY